MREGEGGGGRGREGGVQTHWDGAAVSIDFHETLLGVKVILLTSCLLQTKPAHTHTHTQTHKVLSVYVDCK